MTGWDAKAKGVGGGDAPTPGRADVKEEILKCGLNAGGKCAIFSQNQNVNVKSVETNVEASND